MNIPPEEERFAKNAATLSQAVLEGATKLSAAGLNTIDIRMVRIASDFTASLDKHYLIRTFIEKSHKLCWDRIRSRDVHFFIENVNSIFPQLPGDSVNLFRDIFLAEDAQGQSIVSPILKDQMWLLLQAMIKISIKYVHKYRQPLTTAAGDQIYQAEFMPEVQIPHHSEVWKLTLSF